MVMICTRKPHKNSHRRTKATPDPNTSIASSEQEHSTGALPPPFSALLILPAFTNSASALLGRRSGAATAVAAPACTIYGATQRGRVRHKQTAASRRRQKQSQKRARQNRKRVDEQRDQTSRRPMSDIDIMGANAEAEPATASIAAAKRESMLSRNNSVGWGNPRQNPVTNSALLRQIVAFLVTANGFHARLRCTSSRRLRRRLRTNDVYGHGSS